MYLTHKDWDDPMEIPPKLKKPLPLPNLLKKIALSDIIITLERQKNFHEPIWEILLNYEK